VAILGKLNKEDKMKYTLIFFALLLSILIVLGTVFITNILSLHSTNLQKRLPYECGEQTIGPSWIKFNAGFYIFGLIFLLFDIESIFLFPWTLVLREVGLVGLIEVLIFIFILILGLIYAWKKGDLEWKL
jgi:NADH-quinone oxidoreductase subunit A